MKIAKLRIWPNPAHHQDPLGGSDEGGLLQPAAHRGQRAHGRGREGHREPGPGIHPHTLGAGTQQVGVNCNAIPQQTT